MTHVDHALPAILPDGEIRPVIRAPLVERFSWALYDFSNTIFSMNVATLYFSAWLVGDLGASNTAYAVLNAIASLLVVFSIPVLGAVSDLRRRRKPWVVGFTVVACAACAAIGILGQTSLPVFGTNVGNPDVVAAGWRPETGTLLPVMIAFIVANYAYQSAQPFYNAMMPELVPIEEQGRLSGLGTAIGYVGSVVGVLLVMPFFRGGLPLVGDLGSGAMSALHAVFPFTERGGRIATFVPTGLLFLLFSLPLFFFCRDHNPASRGGRIDWRKAFRDVAHTIRDAKQHPGTLRFIITSFVYQDAIGTIVGFMTLYAIKAVGFTEGSEVTLFLVLTVPSIFGSYFYGQLVDRIGAKRSLMMTLIGWIVLLCVMIVVPGKMAFWMVGLAIGLNFGGVPTAERPVLLGLVPDVEAGRYFSLMLLSSRAAAIAGPLIWGFTVDSLESTFGTAIAYRAAVMTVALMFVIAVFLLRGVPEARRVEA
jgi:UMF1 family MFS transporter